MHSESGIGEIYGCFGTETLVYSVTARVDKIRRKKYEATGIETVVSPRFIGRSK